MNRGLFTSDRQDWETPAALFRTLDAEFGFELDVCATKENAKCSAFFSPEVDGLKEAWHGVCWMNPPYGSAIRLWMAKAYSSSLEGATVVCLVPSRTDTRWWHDFVMRGEIRFVEGRVSFGNGENPAPFPSAIVVFRPKRYLSMALARRIKKRAGASTNRQS
jgi:phage N-6-adenine-methyltransferase